MIGRRRAMGGGWAGDPNSSWKLQSSWTCPPMSQRLPQTPYPKPSLSVLLSPPLHSVPPISVNDLTIESPKSQNLGSHPRLPHTPNWISVLIRSVFPFISPICLSSPTSWPHPILVSFIDSLIHSLIQQRCSKHLPCARERASH